MSERVNGNGFSAELCIAYGTVNYVIVRSVVCAVGVNVVFFDNFACSVSERGGFVIYVSIIAYRTSVSCITVFCTSRSGYNCFVIMAECVNAISNIRASAYVTSIGCVTCFSTSGSSYNCVIAVPLDSHCSVYERYVVVSLETNEPFHSGNEACDVVAVFLNRFPIDFNERDYKLEIVTFCKTVNSPGEVRELTEVNGYIVHSYGNLCSLNNKLAYFDSNALVTVIEYDNVIRTCISGSYGAIVESVKREVKNLNVFSINCNLVAVNIGEDYISNIVSLAVISNFNLIISAEAYVINILNYYDSA